MSFEIMVDSVKYSTKPKNAAGAIKSRLATTCSKPQELNLTDLRQIVESGGTFCPAIIEPTPNSKGQPSHNAAGFRRQQLFFVDIDNDCKGEDGQKHRLPEGEYVTVSNALDICSAHNLHPAIMYNSFSSTADLVKFRIGFILDSVITDDTEREAIARALIDIFGRASDDSCKNADRIFFGSTPGSVFRCDESQVTSKAAFLEIWKQMQEREQQTAPAAFPRDQSPSSSPTPSAAATYEAAKDPQFDADPVKLLFMLDPNKLTYDDWVKVTGAYKNAGGDRVSWDVWCCYYSTNNMKENERTWNTCGKSGKNGAASVGTLKKYAKERNPAAYDSYISELNDRQREARRAKVARDAFTPTPTQSGGSPAAAPTAPPGIHVLTMPDGAPLIVPLWITANKQGTLKLSPIRMEELVRTKYSLIYTRSGDAMGKSMYLYAPDTGYFRYTDRRGLTSIVKAIIDEYNGSAQKKIDNYGKEMEEAVKLISIPKAADEYKPEMLDSYESVIGYKNCMVDVKTGKTYAHSPKFRSTRQLPINYEPGKRYTLEDAPVFAKYLDDLTSGDPDRKKLLLEYAGAAFSNIDGARYKKILYLVGAGDSGKSVYVKMVAKFVGEEFSASTRFNMLDKQFQAAVIVGKRFVYDPDLADEIAVGNNTIMNCTGGDYISIERKGQDVFDYLFRGLMCVCSNEMPRTRGNLKDAYYNRLIFCLCPNPVPREKQDKLLLDKLDKEREAIISICLDAFLETTTAERNYTFTVPADNADIIRDLKAENDCISEFFMEYCKLYENQTADGNPYTRTAFYNVFKDWFTNTRPHRTPPNSRAFFKKICEYYNLPNDHRKAHGVRYCLVTLTLEGKNELRPGSIFIPAGQAEA